MTELSLTGLVVGCGLLWGLVCFVAGALFEEWCARVRLGRPYKELVDRKIEWERRGHTH